MVRLIKETFLKEPSSISLLDIIAIIFAAFLCIAVCSATYNLVGEMQATKHKESLACLEQSKVNDCNPFSPTDSCRALIDCATKGQ